MECFEVQITLALKINDKLFCFLNANEVSYYEVAFFKFTIQFKIKKYKSLIEIDYILYVINAVNYIPDVTNLK